MGWLPLCGYCLPQLLTLIKQQKFGWVIGVKTTSPPKGTSASRKWPGKLAWEARLERCSRVKLGHEKPSIAKDLRWNSLHWVIQAIFHHLWALLLVLLIQLITDNYAKSPSSDDCENLLAEKNRGKGFCVVADSLQFTAWKPERCGRQACQLVRRRFSFIDQRSLRNRRL